MDNNTLLLLLVIVLAIVIVAGFFLFRGRSKASLQAGPVKLNFEGAGKSGVDSTGAAAPAAAPAPPAEPPPPDFEVTNIKAGWDANIKNQAGGRTKVDQVEAKGTVDIERSQQDTTPPKA